MHYRPSARSKESEKHSEQRVLLRQTAQLATPV
jgi:hypothetical protein